MPAPSDESVAVTATPLPRLNAIVLLTTAFALGDRVAGRPELDLMDQDAVACIAELVRHSRPDRFDCPG